MNRVLFEGLVPSDTLTVAFPMKERTFVRTAGVRTEEETACTIRMRGNTVMDISPRDESPLAIPMYLRDHLSKSDKAPMKKLTRVVAPKAPRW